jgi:hypothetical protein
MSRGSAYTPQLAALCVEVCEACAAECAKHPMDHCQDCALACRRCASDCRRVGDSAAQPAVRRAATG